MTGLTTEPFSLRSQELDRRNLIARQLASLILSSIVWCGAAHGSVANGKAIYDGRKESLAGTPTKAEEALVRKLCFLRARAFWKDDKSCDAASFTVLSCAAGSFTRRGAGQKAFLYQYCLTGHNFATNGIAILEGRKLVAHYGYQGSADSGILTLPDLNNDGCNDIAIEDGSINQGYVTSSVALYALQKEPRSLGLFHTYEDNSGTTEALSKTASQIFAQPGKMPKFAAQKFAFQKKQWQPAGKITPLKPEKSYIEMQRL
jgi:hypothetical protein